jgi:hypothetical protein
VGVATIVDNDAGGSLSINDVAALEGPAGTSTLSFTVTLSAASAQTVTANFATADGTATAGSDYQAQTGVVTFVPGDVSETINILVNGDTTAEPDETFFVNLSGAANASINDSQGVGTILTDDGTPPGTSTFTISDVSRAEGNSGTTPFTFTVSLSQAPGAGHTATVNYSTSDGTANAATDYTFQGGTLSFSAGQTARTITVPVLGDTTTEPNETFNVNLSGAACGGAGCTIPTITDATGLGTIVNDDGPTPTPTPSTSPSPSIGTNTVKIGGYFQVRISGTPECIANRAVKVKQSVPGTDKVRASGVTNSEGVFKKAVRPRRSGTFYAQIYPVTVGGVSCPGKKSPKRVLPA